MQQLSIVSASFTQSEYTADKDQVYKWPTAYVVDEVGRIYEHKQLGGGGRIFLITQDTSERLKKVPVILPEEIHHLPGGRIPLDMFSKICSFFKRVMTDKGHGSASTSYYSGRSNEAMAHILWNIQTKQYEIGIPTQKVATASVDFKYDDVRDDHIIIVDVHSHNNMSAFWSARDDKEDQKGIWFSGVVGTMGTHPSTNWRFSNHGKFYKQTFEDIFDGKFSDVDFNAEFPAEWLEKVEQKSYSTPSGYSSSISVRRGGGETFLSHDEYLEDYPGLFLSKEEQDLYRSKYDSDRFRWRASSKSTRSKDVTYSELREELYSLLNELSEIEERARDSNLPSRPRLVLPKEKLCRAIYIVMESVGDSALEDAFTAISNSLSNVRRSAYGVRKTRLLLRELDAQLYQTEKLARS